MIFCTSQGSQSSSSSSLEQGLARASVRVSGMESGKALERESGRASGMESDLGLALVSDSALGLVSEKA